MVHGIGQDVPGGEFIGIQPFAGFRMVIFPHEPELFDGLVNQLHSIISQRFGLLPETVTEQSVEDEPVQRDPDGPLPVGIGQAGPVAETGRE